MNYIAKKKYYVENNKYISNDHKHKLLKSLSVDYAKPNKNDHDEFIGINKMKELLYEQLKEFENYYKNEDWNAFHNSHYDWWTFPICDKSSCGYKYTVYEDEIAELKKDEKYMNALKKCIQLVCYAWGYDVVNKHIFNETLWSNWPVRLYKIALCADLFQLEELDSIISYGQYLIHEGNVFEYAGYNLEYIFI